MVKMLVKLLVDVSGKAPGNGQKASSLKPMRETNVEFLIPGFSMARSFLLLLFGKCQPANAKIVPSLQGTSEYRKTNLSWDH